MAIGNVTEVAGVVAHAATMGGTNAWTGFAREGPPTVRGSDGGHQIQRMHATHRMRFC